MRAFSWAARARASFRARRPEPPSACIRKASARAAEASARAPDETWRVDFKGPFALGDKSRCSPPTLTDQVSRYLLERAFRELGRPRRIRSDNGPPFATTGIGGLSELGVWWIKLERMHRTLNDDDLTDPLAGGDGGSLEPRVRRSFSILGIGHAALTTPARAGSMPAPHASRSPCRPRRSRPSRLGSRAA
ncbi:Mobile element protein [Minicystis rosea]|nr:Mobile element protein [Minicystis rosea]